MHRFWVELKTGFALSLLLLLVSPVWAQEYPNQEEMLRQLEAWTEMLKGDIDIRGRVVSTNGQPLMDVKVNYYFRKLGDVVARKEIVRESLRADGEFRIERSDISSVNLSFLKPGFYSEQWSFSFNEETPRTNPGGAEIVEIEIVLEKQAERAPLEKRQGILRADTRGPVSVVEVKRQGNRESWLWRNGEKRDFDWPHVFLVAAEGYGTALPKSDLEVEGRRYPQKGLEQGWIRFSHPSVGDGFVVYDPGEIPFRPEIAMRGMTEAPDKGYEPSLELAAAESPQKVFFYCRVNGKYGKGMVTGRPIIAVEDDREVARTSILIYLNSEGSRNVSYVHN